MMRSKPGFFLEETNRVCPTPASNGLPLPSTQSSSMHRAPPRWPHRLGAGLCGYLTGNVACRAPALTELTSVYLLLEI